MRHPDKRALAPFLERLEEMDAVIAMEMRRSVLQVRREAEALQKLQQLEAEVIAVKASRPGGKVMKDFREVALKMQPIHQSLSQYLADEQCRFLEFCQKHRELERDIKATGLDAHFLILQKRRQISEGIIKWTDLPRHARSRIMKTAMNMGDHMYNVAEETLDQVKEHVIAAAAVGGIQHSLPAIPKINLGKLKAP